MFYSVRSRAYATIETHLQNKFPESSFYWIIQDIFVISVVFNQICSLDIYYLINRAQ